MRPSYQNEGEVKPDNLVGGDFPVATDTVTILKGQVLKRGAVLGAITANNKHVLSASAAADGSEEPVVILAEDIDATADDVKAPVYLTGQYNSRALTLGAGHTIASVKKALRPLSIFVKETVGA
jgi:hypothetical protein